jgi:hypothetical protein
MWWRRREPQGYGNIYTPHAGSMVIQVQRERGLANRTLTFTLAQVRLFRAALWVGGTVLVLVLMSWAWFAYRASQVPALRDEIETLRVANTRIDTLQGALVEMERRYHQVQLLLGLADAPGGLAANSTGVRDTEPESWPLPVSGRVLGPSANGGVLIGVPLGTWVRAAGGGTIVEVSGDPRLGQLIRVRHAGGFQSVYRNVTDARVSTGQRVGTGTPIARSGPSGNAAEPHLQFELWKDGRAVDPTTLNK